jgi:transitional endoplasmic reticulum ATPase
MLAYYWCYLYLVSIVTNPNDALSALRAALQFSPDNIPLRQHIADTLLTRGEAAAAAIEYQQALALAPQNLDLKLGLAKAYYQQEGKDSTALVIIEDLLAQGETSPTILTLHARLLMRSGDLTTAAQQFRKALAEDSSLQESDLVDRLGVKQAEANDDYNDFDSSPLPEGMEKPGISFQDVGGMEEVKEEIRLKIIYPLTHAEMYRAYGKSIGGGILLYGPPGCGKTHLARATAGEIQAGFISVGLNEILDMWIGNSEKNLHQLFDRARRNQPSVLFFDEVDALAASRADLRQSSGKQLINQFLTELDGVQYSNEGVLILAATNAPWHLDTAFRRPGRFDRILLIPPPDAAARAAILRIICQGKPIEDIDYQFLAQKTEGCSGADLKLVVDLAVEKKLQAAMKTGIPQPLTTKDLATAASGVKSSTREWFNTAKNYATHANQDGNYDDILKYLKM